MASSRAASLVGEFVVDGGADGLCGFFPTIHALVVVFDLLFRGDGDAVGWQDGGEAGLETVVVGLFDGVELMVVAASATDGEAHEREAGVFGDVVEDFLTLLHHVGSVDVFGIKTDEAGCDEGVGIVGFEFVAGDLLTEEAIVGKVVVEEPDDVVAVTMGVFAEAVVFEAFGFAVADQVEPMLSPAFAIARRSEEAIDDFGVGVGE